MKNTVEKIFVIPTSIITAKIKTEGFIPYQESLFQEIISHGEFCERSSVETNPSFRQLIPYIVCFNGEGLFVYQRSSEGQESRLHSKYSLGVGGHINENDRQITSIDTIKTAIVREMREELDLTTLPDQYYPIGFLSDPSTGAIGEVHFGIVYLYPYLFHIKLKLGETHILVNRHIISLYDIQTLYGSLEDWSRYCYDHLLEISTPPLANIYDIRSDSLEFYQADCLCHIRDSCHLPSCPRALGQTVHEYWMHTPREIILQYVLYLENILQYKEQQLLHFC
jgi:predicted NUDIX family phosphoesterase